ncbi:hypothetical protein NDI39_10285 [Microcoleus sp. ZQ-A2]|nr:hypothetical protein [Microcoleus sp. FACHB-1]
MSSKTQGTQRYIELILGRAYPFESNSAVIPYNAPITLLARPCKEILEDYEYKD